MSENEQLDNFTEGRFDYEMDVDRMVNEGLGGGLVTMDNGYIGDTAVDTMNEYGAIKSQNAMDPSKATEDKQS